MKQIFLINNSNIKLKDWKVVAKEIRINFKN